MYNVYLGLGANMGERHLFLNRAVAELKKLKDIKIIWASPVFETEPYGKTDQPKFLNAAIEVETPLVPDQLYSKVKEIESQLGRTSTERWGPREIDVDILMYDGLVFQNENVTVPHPELAKRKFVLIPLREIAPDLVHPVNGLTVTEMASACKDSCKVVQSTYHIVI